MADETTTQEDVTTEAAPQGDGTDWKAEARKWEGRAKASNERLKGFEGLDVDDLKAKAARLEELESANKSELERISEQATQAQQSAADWQAKFERLQTERQHELDVRRAASEYGVDADVLMRMGGDVDENAQFLKDKEAARPKFGDMRDGGEQRPQGRTLDEIRAIRDPQERIRARAKYIRDHPEK